jgi:LacI family transcriptional regulator
LTVTCPKFTTDCVIIDNELSCYNAIVHLIEQGCQNSAFITLESGQTQMQERIAGYKKAQEEHGFPVNIKEIHFHEDPVRMVDEIVTFLNLHPETDSVLFGTNYLAINGLKAIKQMGKVIGTDIAVVAFDDHELFELYKPSITVISQPIDEIAANVISLLLNASTIPKKMRIRNAWY